jgi:hypothetical protein
MACHEIEALLSLVASGASPAAVDCTDVLSDLLPAIAAVEPSVLKAVQRDAEDALLKVVLTPPGVGPLQRTLAGACLASLFVHGSSIAMYARVSELTAMLTTKGVSKTAPGIRVGALELLVALSHGLHAQLAGSFGRIVTEVCVKHAASADAPVRAAALALLAAALEHAPALPPGAQEAALKIVQAACADKVATVRGAAIGSLASMATGNSGASLWVGDKGCRGEVFAEAVALSQSALKDSERVVRDTAGAALGALAAAALLPPAAGALSSAAPDARARLAKVLEDPVGDALGAMFVRSKSRPVRTAVADAWVAFLAIVAGRLEDAVVVKHAVSAVAALRTLAATPGRVNAGDDDVHAAACALYIVRAGAARHLTEAGQQLLLADLLAQIGEQPQSEPSLVLIAALRGCGDTLSRLGEVSDDVADDAEAPLLRALADSPTEAARAEAALALRGLALASPPTAARLLRFGLDGLLQVADVRALDAPAAAQLHGHASLVAAIIAGAPTLLYGLPVELPAEALESALTLIGRSVPAVKTSGWLLLAAVLAGPGGSKAAAAHGPTLLQLWNIAFTREAVVTQRNGAPELRFKGAEAVAELSWRAAAAESLEAFLRTATSVGVRAAASSAASLGPTLRAALTLATDAALSEASVPAGAERAAACLFRLRLLEALRALPSASMYAPQHQQVILLAAECLDPAAPAAGALLLSLLQAADSSLGPVAPGHDALEDTLRVFQGGGAHAPPPKLWLPLAQGAVHTLGPFPSPLSCCNALAEAQAIECGRLWAAASGDARNSLMARFAAAARSGYSLPRDAGLRVGSSFGRKPGSSSLVEGAVGGTPLLTNAAAAGLAALGALPPSAPAFTPQEAAALEDLGRALAGDPAPGVVHLRAAAELRGAATRTTGDGALRAVGELIRALRAEKVAAARGSCALAIGSAFRASGGMALAPAMAAAVDALATAAADPDASQSAAHMWAAHGLWLVAGAASAAFVKHAALTLNLSHGLLSSDLALFGCPRLIETAGRLVNGAVAAFGPELDPGGRKFQRCEALITHVRTAFRDDPGAQLQAVLFLQSCVLFAPQTLSPAAIAPQLRAALCSRQPPLRAAAASVAHNLAETNPDGVLPEGLEEPLFGLLDFEYDSGTVSDACAALEALLRADAPAAPMRWLRLTGAIACADASREAASPDPGAADADDDDQQEGERGDSATKPAALAMPSWRTRAFAAELMARVPNAVGKVREHFDLRAAREDAASAPAGSAPPGWLVLHLQAAVDLGYRVSTGPTAALRPWGLVLLRMLLLRWGDATDPDVTDAALMEQYSAQILSSLRAALSPGCAPNACAAGALLAAEFVACGLSARDPAVHKRVLALLGTVTAVWGPPPVEDGDDEPQYSQWSAMCTKAALLAAHARMAAACPADAMLRVTQAKIAAALSSGWLALLHDFAEAVGLVDGAALDDGDEDEHCLTVLSLTDVPLARHPIAHAHLAYAWRPVLAAVSAFAVPQADDGRAAGSSCTPVPLGPNEYAMVLSVACWALTRDAAAFSRSASKFESSSAAGVWGVGPGFVSNDPAAAAGSAALSALLAPQFLNADHAPLQTLADVMSGVAAAAAARGAHPLLATAVPTVLQRVGSALPAEVLVCADADEQEAHDLAAGDLFASALSITQAAVERALLPGCPPALVESAVQSCSGLASLAARVSYEGVPEALAEALRAAVELSLGVVSNSSAPESMIAAAAALLGAAAGACGEPSLVASAAETVSHACMDLAEDAAAASHLGALLTAVSALGAAADAGSAAQRHCLDAFSVLLDEDAGCPLAVQREVVLALARVVAEVPGKRSWAEALLASAGPAAAAGASRALLAPLVPEAAAVVSEVLKLLAAAAAWADSDDAKVHWLSMLLPLVIDAAAPDNGAPALQASAVALVTRTAGVAPGAFKQAVGSLAPDAKGRLQAALRAGTPAVAQASSARPAVGAGRVAAPPPISLKGFKPPPR